VSVQPVERKLAAIFAADIAGYSRLMARDEVCTLARMVAVVGAGIRRSPITEGYNTLPDKFRVLALSGYAPSNCRT
jgi:hypothetical protein